MKSICHPKPSSIWREAPRSACLLLLLLKANLREIFNSDNGRLQPQLLKKKARIVHECNQLAPVILVATNG